MDISKLSTFLAVADAGSFGKATVKTGYSQAGISYAVSSLEEELGVQLFQRTSNGVKLTSYGKVLLPEIRKVVNSYNGMQSVLNAQKQNSTGILHIAAIETMATMWLPYAISEFHKTYPDILIETITGDPFEINELMLNGEADIGLSEKAWNSSELHWIHVAKDPYMVVLPHDTPAPNPCPISFLDGRWFYMADYSRERNVPILLQEHGVNVKLLNDRLSNSTLLNIIGSGTEATIMPAISIKLWNPYYGNESMLPKVIPIKEKAFRDLGVTIREEDRNNKMFKDFAKCIKKAAETL